MALGEDAFKHGCEVIRDRLADEGESLELIVLLFANTPTVSGQLIDEGIEALRKNSNLDSAVTVSCYNMWSPLRARQVGEDVCLYSFVRFGTFGDQNNLNCD